VARGNDFTKFPRTPHLFWLGSGQPRGDKLLDPNKAAELLGLPAAAEEKVDGSNLGLSIDDHGRVRAQSRGGYVEPKTHAQYAPLGRWLAIHGARLVDSLGRTLILFGEWCYARHTIRYDRLPDWFLAFDVFDRKEHRFWSRRRRDELCRVIGIAAVPLLEPRVVGRAAVDALMDTPSRLGAEKVEGVVLRWDDDDWQLASAKVVRPGWVPADEQHWSRRPVSPNVISVSERRSAV
jgi:ATP-dependent RNA circularization protein (DNA/RNA ligase family)